MYSSLIKDLMELWEGIINDPSPISSINDIPLLKENEMTRIAQNFYDRYGNLSCVQFEKKNIAEYSSCTLKYKDFWILIPYYFYLDKAIGTLYYKLKNELLVDNGEYPCDLEAFFYAWWRVDANHFGCYNNIDIKILKAMVVLYDQETRYGFPSSDEIAKYLRKSLGYVNRQRSRLARWAYCYRALINYGKFGFTTLAIWDLPEDIESHLRPYRLVTCRNRQSIITILSLPYDTNVCLQEELMNRSFPDEFVISLTGQGWHWNLNQLNQFEEDSWKRPVRTGKMLKRMILSSDVSSDIKIERPYLIQDIGSSHFGKKKIETSPEDMQVLRRILKDFPSFTWMSQETERSDYRIRAVFDRLRKAEMMDIRLDFKNIGLGASYGLFFVVSNPLSEERDPLIDQLLSLVREYPFSWTLIGDRMLFAFIVMPKKWSYDFYVDWSSVARQYNSKPSLNTPSLTVEVCHSSIFRRFFQLPWEDLWYEKGGEVVWKNPL